MAILEISETTILQTTECCKCGAPFAFSKTVMDRQRKRGGSHWCPICGNYQGWNGESEEAERKRQIAALKDEISRKAEEARRARQDAEYYQSSRNAYKGQVTKLKNRAANGVCPCCNRYFANLHRHMETKHPDFKNEESK